MSVNSRLKATKVIGQRKAFYSQRIPDSSCATTETVEIDILVTSGNGDRKIMQSIRITIRPPWRKRQWNQLSQFRRTYTNFSNFSNTYRKDLSWPHFVNKPRVQKKQQVKDQQSCRFVFIVCLTIPSSNQGHQPRCDNSIPYIGVWQIYKDTWQPQEKETSQNKLKLQQRFSSFSNRDN